MLLKEIDVKCHRKEVVHDYYRSEPLGIPIDLSNQDGLIEALNGLAADAVALYLKTKNYHWHVFRSYFREYYPTVKA